MAGSGADDRPDLAGRDPRRRRRGLRRLPHGNRDPRVRGDPGQPRNAAPPPDRRRAGRVPHPVVVGLARGGLPGSHAKTSPRPCSTRPTTASWSTEISRRSTGRSATRASRRDPLDGRRVTRRGAAGERLPPQLRGDLRRRVGDKSQLMALAFATRYRAVTVLVAISVATLVVHAGSVSSACGRRRRARQRDQSRRRAGVLRVRGVDVPG